MDKLQPYINKLDAGLNKCTFLVEIEKQYKVPKAYLTIALWVLYVTAVVSGNGAGLATTLLGLGVPVSKAAKSWNNLAGNS